MFTHLTVGRERGMISTAGRQFRPPKLKKLLGLGKGSQEGRATSSSFKENSPLSRRWDGRTLAAPPTSHAWERQSCHQIITFHNIVLIHRLNNVQKEMGEAVKNLERGRREGKFSYQAITLGLCFFFTLFLQFLCLTITFVAFKQL